MTMDTKSFTQPLLTHFKNSPCDAQNPDKITKIFNAPSTNNTHPHTFLLTYNGVSIKVVNPDTDSCENLAEIGLIGDELSNNVQIAYKGALTLIFLHSLKHNCVYVLYLMFSAKSKSFSFAKIEQTSLQKSAHSARKLISFNTSKNRIFASFSDKSLVSFQYVITPKHELNLDQHRQLAKPMRVLRRVFRKDYFVHLDYCEKLDIVLAFNIDSSLSIFDANSCALLAQKRVCLDLSRKAKDSQLERVGYMLIEFGANCSESKRSLLILFPENSVLARRKTLFLWELVLETKSASKRNCKLKFIEDVKLNILVERLVELGVAETALALLLESEIFSGVGLIENSMKSLENAWKTISSPIPSPDANTKLLTYFGNSASPEDFQIWGESPQLAEKSFWNLLFWYFHKPPLFSSELLFHIGCKCLNSPDARPFSRGKIDFLISETIFRSLALRKYYNALHLMTSNSENRDAQIVSTVIGEFYRHERLDLLLGVSWGKCAKAVQSVLERLSREESPDVFSLRVVRNKHRKNLAAVFGPLGVLVHYSASNLEAQSVARHLFEIFSKIEGDAQLGELQRLKLITPIVCVLKNFLGKHQIKFILQNDSSAPKSVSKAQIDKSFILFLAKYVLLSPRHAHPSKQPLPTPSNAPSLAQKLVSQGFVSLAFALLSEFKADLTPLFVEVAEKCAEIQRASFESSYNDSVLPPSARLQLRFDVGSRFSRVSWSLLEALLLRFDAKDQRYALAVARHFLSRPEKFFPSERRPETRRLCFFPQFLVDILKGLLTPRRSVSEENGRWRSSGASEVECFSHPSNFVFLLNLMVTNGFLFQAAEMAIHYCRNERLRYLKHKKEVWYPRNTLIKLECLLESALALNKTKKCKNFRLLKLLFVNLKTELGLCDTLDNALFE